MNKIIKYLIGIIVITLSSFGIIINILHFIEIRKVESINLKDNSNYVQIKDIISDIKKNRSKISNSIIKEEDMSSIKEGLNTCYEALSDLKLFDYEDHKSINNLEKYEIVDNIATTRCPALLVNSMNKASLYSENISKLKIIYASSLYESLNNITTINNKLRLNYKYGITLYSPGDINNDTKDIDIILNSVRTQALILDYIVDYLIDLED
jgi:hypothetical protein